MSELLSIDDLSYKLPITNFVFVVVILGYCVPFLLSNSNVESYLICRSDFNLFLPSLDWINFLLSRIVFFDFKNYFFTLVLITIFRSFEKIYGSKKFANYMFANFIVSTIIELILIKLLNHFEIVNIPYLANGCYSYIFALFINYCKDIPKEKFDFFGISFSEKLLIYFFGLQMIFTSFNVLVSCIAGLLSGLVCRSNSFNVCDLFHLPDRFLVLLLKFLNIVLLTNNAPKEASLINGATQSDRRNQYMEYMEQNLLNSQTNLATTSNATNQSSSNLINEEELQQNINQLQEMGFDFERAKQILIETNNDLSRATHLLLEDN